MKKVFIVFFCTLFLLVGISMSPAQASTSTSLENQNIGNSGVIDLNNLEELEKTGEVTVRELTYEEFLQNRAIARGITLEEARELYSKSSKKSSKKGNPTEYQTLTTSDNCAGNYSMHEMNIVQNVNSGFYRPAVQIFACTYNSGSFSQFMYIEEVNLDRNGITNSYTSKQFTGTIKGKMTSSTAIWWYVNGDFYNNGTTSFTGGVGGERAIKGVTVEGSFSVTNASNHYEYWENSGTKFAY